MMESPHPKHRPEDLDAGEVVGAYDPDPDAGIHLVIEIPPPDSRSLVRLADRTGVNVIDLARELLREAVDQRLATGAPPPEGR
jgi:hypothetical protein